MTLGQRRILYTLFIMAFCAITPLAWLYAAGYKIGGGFKVQKTGILVLDSAPEGARIALNGETQQYFLDRWLGSGRRYVTTPAKIKNLLPGAYEVRLEAEGHWPWQKKLAVLPGQSTFAEDVVLFRNNLPLLLQSGRFTSFRLSPDGRSALAGNGQAAVAVDLGGQPARWLARATGSPELAPWDIRWSPARDRLSVGRDVYLSLDGPAAPYRSPRLDRAQFMDWLDRDRLVFADSDQLLSHDLRDGGEKVILHGSRPQDILVDGGRVYAIVSQPATSKLALIDPSGPAVQELTELPPSRYRFIGAQGPYVLVRDEKFGLVYLLEPGSPFRPIREVLNGARQAALVGEDTLLYATDHEIWLMDLRNRRQTLLSRLSETIGAVLWHPSRNYVIFATENRIAAMELDDRERYNVTELLNLPGTNGLSLSADGKSLFFLARIGNQEGLYKLEIQ